MNGEQFLARILPSWRASVAPIVGGEWFDRFVEQQRAAILKELEPVVLAIRARQARAPEKAPPDEWTPARRTRANLDAMEVLASRKEPADLSAEERTKLRRYSGWGGLSIEKNEDKFPAGWDPETFGLIHEYYTPSRVARAIGEMLCPLLDSIKGADGRVLALEPSAGIGRLIQGVEQASCANKPPVDWITVEYSRVSSAILPRLWPDQEHHAGSFEEWIDKNSREHGGQWKPDFFHKIQLVVSNPPYGERGLTRRNDPVAEYKAERMAYAYFMRRSLDLLVPRGIGVFLVPAGFLTGRTDSQQDLREKILRRHHLAAAYRLPSNLFPGAQLVTDLLVWRARGGALSEVHADDEFIANGHYFDEFPEHILGREEGRDYGRDDQLTTKKKGRAWYRVIGKFEGLPKFWERGICTSCRIKPLEFPSAATRVPATAVRKLEVKGEHSRAVEAALYLGVRIGAFLKALSSEESNALLLWKDLNTTLLEFWDSKLRKEEAPDDNPKKWETLVKLAESGNNPAQLFLGAWTPAGDLVAAIRKEPEIPARWSGAPDDVTGQARYMYLARRYLVLEEFEVFHRDIGGPFGREELLELLLAADWNLDPTAAPEVKHLSSDEVMDAIVGQRATGGADTYLTPLEDYVTGVLWPKYDHARAQIGDQWAKQAELLRKAIDEVEYEDIESYSPQDGWVPVSLVSEWAQATISPTLKLDRDKGLYSIRGLDYSNPESYRYLIPESLWFLGWLNHESSLFTPKVSETEEEKRARRKRKEKLPKTSVLRKRKVDEWESSFRAWVREDDERQVRLTDAYNRAFRGYTHPSYSDEPFEIARWSDRIKLYPHQIQGARRLLANRGGLLAFDTGVGKTYTLLAVLARARQEGWARRPVLITPVSLLWKWRNDFENALPDFRVAVIGSELHQRSKGKIVDDAKKLLAEGVINEEQYRSRITVSQPDSKQRQRDKWMAFISGAYDAVILSVEAMSALKVDEKSVIDYAENLAAVQRSIAITARNARIQEEKNQDAKDKGEKVSKRNELSERRRAIMEHKTAAWVADKLEGDKTEKDYVPGLTWSDLKVDLLLVDEAAMFKNLWGVVKSWGKVPKWIGNSSPSNRAWQFDFRAADVRKRTGGTGVALATATPFPNGVGDAFSMMKYIDSNCWARLGIDDPYQFVDQFVKIEDREYIDPSSFNLETGPAVVGFNNLEKLRTVILRYGEFRTAIDVGLDRIMPEPRNAQIFVDLDETQEDKYSYEVERLEKLLKLPTSTEEEEEIAEIRSQVLAIQARLTLVALHGLADEGYSWSNARDGGKATKKISRLQLDRYLADGWELDAPLKDSDENASVAKYLPKPDPTSPKGLKCAELILAQRNCGHIVFCQNLAPQVWLVEVLVQAGIPRERIGVLNAKVAASDRPKIATKFTGDPDKGEAPSLDVVICNSVAYEGLDLQLRTCAIHHLDLPWTPGDLEQRNGRGYRQKNACPILNIYYYLSRGSTDGVRLTNVQGKSSWMEDLLDLSKDKVNNPAAESDLTAEDLLIELSRDKEAVRRLIAEKKERKREEAYRKVRQLALQLMSAVDGRYRRIRAGLPPDKAAKLREEAEGALAQLMLTDAKAWPWVEWARTVRDVRWLLPLKHDGVPVFEDLRIVRRDRVDPERIEAFEFGLVFGTEVSLRVAGGATWRRIDTIEVQQLGVSPEDMPGKTVYEWPADDMTRTREAIERHLARAVRADSSWADIGWLGATDSWITKWWPVFKSRIVERLAKSVLGENVPVVRDGVLEFRSGPVIRDVEVLPPTRAGWFRFLQLAPASGASYKELQAAGEMWWWRDVPFGLLNKEAARAATKTTPGTRISWRGVGDWLTALETIQARDDKKRRDDATVAHLSALAEAPDVIAAADDLAALEAKVDELDAVESYRESVESLRQAIASANSKPKDTTGEKQADQTDRRDVFARDYARAYAEIMRSFPTRFNNVASVLDDAALGRVRDISAKLIEALSDDIVTVPAKVTKDVATVPSAAVIRPLRDNPAFRVVLVDDNNGLHWVVLGEMLDGAERDAQQFRIEGELPNRSEIVLWQPLEETKYEYAKSIGLDDEKEVDISQMDEEEVYHDLASVKLVWEHIKAIQSYQNGERVALNPHADPPLGFPKPPRQPNNATNEDLATKGIRASWRDLDEWLDLMIEIEGRRASAGKHDKIRAHVEALVNNLDLALARSSDRQVERLWRAWGGGKNTGKDRWTGRGELRAKVLDALDRRCAKKNKEQRIATREEAPRVRAVLGNDELIETYSVWFDENGFRFAADKLRDMAKSSSTTRDGLVRALLDRLHTTFAWMLLTWAWRVDNRKTRGTLKHEPEFIRVPDEAVLWRESVPYLLVTYQGHDAPVPAVWVELSVVESEPHHEDVNFYGGDAKALSISVPVYEYAIRDAALAEQLFRRTPHIALFAPFDDLSAFAGRAREVRRSFRDTEKIERALGIVAELDSLMRGAGAIKSEVVRVVSAPSKDGTVERAIELLANDAHKLERLNDSGTSTRVRIWLDKQNRVDVNLYSSRLAAAWDWSGLDRGGRSRRAWVKKFVDAALNGRRSEIGDLAGTSLDGDSEFRPPRALAEIQDDPELSELASILTERVREQALMSPDDALAVLRRIEFDHAADVLDSYVRGPEESESEREQREAYWSNEGRLVVELREKLLEDANAERLNLDAVPGWAIFGSSHDRFILKTGPEGQDFTRVPVVVKSHGREMERDTRHAVIARSGYAIGTGDMVLSASWEENEEELNESASEIREAFETVDALWRWIKAQPDSLQEYRDILDQATALVLVDKCADDDRASAVAAIEQAEKLWREAVEEVHTPAKSMEVEKIRRTMKSIANATLEVATSCARGQRAMFASELPSSMRAARARFGDRLAGERSLRFARAVRDSLSPDLRRAPYTGDEDDECRGYCYVASEAIWHLLGGKSSRYQPHRIVHEGQPHWYLMSDTDVIDVTACQFRSRVPYKDGKRRAFITGRPSRRARLLMARARSRARSRRRSAA